MINDKFGVVFTFFNLHVELLVKYYGKFYKNQVKSSVELI